MSVPLNIDVQQILLHLFNFVLLFGILYFLLYRPVTKFMQQRQARYAEMDRAAKENLEKANALKAEYEERLKQSEQEILEKRRRTEQELHEKQTQQLTEAQTQAREIVARAQAAAKREQERVTAQAQADLADYVKKAAEQMVFANVSDVYDEFLDHAEMEKEDGQ